MNFLRLLNPAEQVAAHLREQLQGGRWTGEIPGAPALAVEFGVDYRVINSAFRLLEKQGLLTPQGVGKRRRVNLPENFSPLALRVKILTYEGIDKQDFIVADLLHCLHEMGHVASFAPKSLQELGMDLNRVKRMVENIEADAWVIVSASGDILEWFSQQSKPVFAIAGRCLGIPVASASPNKLPELKRAIRRLVDLGHRRIVMLSKEERRKPHPAMFEQEFLAELKILGLPVGEYNLPDWKPNAQDYHRCLDSLFKHTPPTALLIHEMSLFVAAQQYLAQLGILSPRDVSLICLDPNPAFAWCMPTIAHINWDSYPIVRHITNWANDAALGKENRHQLFTRAEFVDGGTIGPVPV